MEILLMSGCGQGGVGCELVVGVVKGVWLV